MIKNLKYSIVYGAMMMVSVMFINNFALAQNIPATKIAIVDNRLIGLNSAVAKDITRQVNQIRTEMQAELTTQENALKTEEESLKSQSSIIPQEAYNQKTEEFQRKVIEYQRDVQTKSRRLEVAIANANAEVERALKPIYQAVLKSSGATMLMDKTMVIEQAPGLDVTTSIIEQLDIQMPSLKVVLPPAPEAAAAVAAPAAN